MHNNAAVKFAPVYSEEKRVDVSLNEDVAEIKLSTWVDGLGWCTQKTMRLDAEMVEELHRVLTAAKLKMRSKRADDNDEILSAKILEFPEFA